MKHIKYILLAISILSSGILQAMAPSAITIEIEKNDYNEISYYKISLFQEPSRLQKGSIEFSFNNSSKKAYISRLHINQNERRKNYGSILLTFALETLTELQAVQVEWQASPFDLVDNEERIAMLPRLIAFYQRHGAQMISLSSHTGTAQMLYKPKQINHPNLQTSSALLQNANAPCLSDHYAVCQ